VLALITNPKAKIVELFDAKNSVGDTSYIP
jgi:hypothetical protein